MYVTDPCVTPDTVMSTDKKKRGDPAHIRFAASLVLLQLNAAKIQRLAAVAELQPFFLTKSIPLNTAVFKSTSRSIHGSMTLEYTVDTVLTKGTYCHGSLRGYLTGVSDCHSIRSRSSFLNDLLFADGL